MVLAGRRRDMLEETAALAKARSGRAMPGGADRRRRPGGDRGACSIRSRATYGRIDLLFNNAGISTRNIPIEDLTLEQWSNVVAVNLTGSFLCAQHAFRMMKSQTPRGGRIINNGSVSAHVPRRNSTPYAATKHALTGLTRSLSLDGREYDIACGQIDIGNAATTRNEDTARGRLQASGKVEAEARIDVERCRARGRLHGQPVARSECPVHDGDGDEDALYRPRLTRPPHRADGELATAHSGAIRSEQAANPPIWPKTTRKSGQSA